MSYYPCGLSAPLLPYKSRPVGFWREALKLLMHSLGLSLVREGAVCIRVCIIYTCVCVIYRDRYVVYRVQRHIYTYAVRNIGDIMDALFVL